MNDIATARGMGAPAPAARRAFPAGVALLFLASAGATVAWHAFPATWNAMALCGGGAPSAWMRLPGQGWLGATAAFAAMWTVMMVAMMLPALAPALWAWRRAAEAAGHPRAPALAALAGAAYFCVWAAVGLALYPLGALWAAAQPRFPLLLAAAPAAAGAVALAAGAIQASRWKARHLARCRHVSGPLHGGPVDAAWAWRAGQRLGRHCLCSCAGPTLLLLAAGIMDLRAMAAVAALIALERLAPAGQRIARLGGLGMIGFGLFVLARAAWPA